MIQVDEAQVFLQQAQTYWQKQNWQLTIETCAEALAKNQNLTAALKLMGDALQRVDKNKEAIGYYVRAISIEPNFAEVYANLGALYAREKEWDRAILHYQHAIKVKPEFVAVYRQLAKVYKVQNQPEKAQAYLDQAKAQEAAFANHQADSATSLRTVNTSASKSLEAYLHQGKILKEQGKLKAALEQYLLAASLDEQRVNTYQEIATLCEELELWSEAAKYCRLILKLTSSKTTNANQSTNQSIHQSSVPNPVPSHLVAPEPTNIPANSYTAKAEYHFNLGTLYDGKHEWSEAAQQYQQAIAINPDMAKAHRNLARSLSQLGDKERSTESWYKAATIENQAVGAEEYVDLGQNLSSWGKHNSAITCYRRAIAKQPDLLAAYLGLGELLVKGRFLEEAITCYTEGLKHIQSGELYYRLGCIYRASEQWSQASLSYQKATQNDPTHGTAYHELGEVLSSQEKWSEAISVYQEAVKLKPDFSWSFNNLGYAHIQLGQWAEAIPVYHQAIKLNPEFPWSYYNLGEAYAKLNQWSEAISVYQQTARIQPDLPKIQQKLGDALYHRSLLDQDLALKHFNLAIQQEPNEPEAYHQALALDKMNLDLYLKLGNILEQQGSTEQAISIYQMALQIQPKNSVAIARLQSILPQSESDHSLENSAVTTLPEPPTPQIIEFSQSDLKF